MKRVIPILVVLGAALTARYAAADDSTSPRTERLEVRDKKAFVYLSPDSNDEIIRRLYPGEVVVPLERVTCENGSVWIKIGIAPDKFGYVLEKHLDKAGKLPETRFKKKSIVRDERPFSVGIRALGESLGGVLNLRYLPFTRIGIELNAGSTMHDWKMRGSALSFGLTSLIALHNFSPLINLGISRNSCHAKTSKMVVTAFYMTAGVEWMFDFGLFLNAGVTYMRSVDIEITYEYETVKDDAESIEAESYVLFEDTLDGGNAFQTVQPCFTLGYSF